MGRCRDLNPLSIPAILMSNVTVVFDPNAITDMHDFVERLILTLQVPDKPGVPENGYEGKEFACTSRQLASTLSR
jgi:hypothetical protein